jgi:hypothetical protein
VREGDLLSVARSAAEIERAAADIAPGTSAERVRELLGEPRVVSELGGGGETWMYLPADPGQGRTESLSVAFDDARRFVRVERKGLD